jgi:hypothetical protein
VYVGIFVGNRVFLQDEGAKVASTEDTGEDGASVGRLIGGKLEKGSPSSAELLDIELHAPRPHTVAEITPVTIRETKKPTKIKNHNGFLGGDFGGLCSDGGGDTPWWVEPPSFPRLCCCLLEDA